MIIEICPDVAELPEVGDSRHARGLKNLAIAHRDGEHLILADPSTAGALARRTDLGTTARRIFARIQAHHPELRMLADLLGRTCRVIGFAQGRDARTVTQKPDDCAAFLDVRHFASIGTIRRTHLVVEHLNDGHVLLYAAQSFRAARDLKSASLQVMLNHGGGGSVDQTLRQAVDADVLTLCVVDSDKTHPNDNLGGTASAALAALREGENHACVHVTDGRELENALPIPVLDEVLGRECTEVMSDLKTLHEQAPDFYLYADLKTGTYLGRALSCSDRRWRAYAGSTAKARGVPEDGSACGECMVRNRCGAPKACSSRVHFGVKRMLRHVADEVRTEPLRRGPTQEWYRANEDHEWVELGRLVFAWGCASRPSVI